MDRGVRVFASVVDNDTAHTNTFFFLLFFSLFSFFFSFVSWCFWNFFNYSCWRIHCKNVFIFSEFWMGMNHFLLATKNTVARVLLLVVSMGYGIVKLSLDSSKQMVAAVALLYFIFDLAYNLGRGLSDIGSRLSPSQLFVVMLLVWTPTISCHAIPIFSCVTIWTYHLFFHHHSHTRRPSLTRASFTGYFDPWHEWLRF